MPTTVTEANSLNFQLFDEGAFLGMGDESAETSGRARKNLKKAIGAVLITWVPLVILATVQGLAMGPTRNESVLFDAGVFARFFVAVPLLILTPDAARQRLVNIVRHFLSA